MNSSNGIRQTRVMRAAGLVLALMLFGGSAALATNQWWDASGAAGLLAGNGVWTNGGGAFWATNVNGNGGPFVWVSGNDANFTTGNSTVTVDGATANSLTVSSTANNVLVPGAGKLTLGAGGLTCGGNVVMVGCDIVCAANQTWTGYVTITGRVSGAAITVNTAPSSNTMTLSNTNNTFNGLSMYCSGTAKALFTYAGGTPLGTGTVTMGVSSAGAVTPGLLTINGVGNNSSTIGDLYVTGDSVLTLNSTSSTNTLIAGNLNRVAGGTLQISAQNGPLGSRENVTFTGGVTPNNGILPAWMVGGKNFDFLNYLPGAGGLTNAIATNALDATTSSQYVKLTGAKTLSVASAAQALNVAYNIDLAGKTLSVGDGTYAGVILANNTSITNSSTAYAALDFGTSEALVFQASSAFSALIAVPITGTNVLTKGSVGTLTISNSALYAGPITVLDGTLVLKPTSNAPSGGPISLLNGTLTINPTVDAVYPGNITGAGSLVKDGPNNLTLTGTNTVALNASAGLTGGGVLTLSGGIFSNVMAGAAMPFAATGNTLVVNNGAHYFGPSPASGTQAPFGSSNCTLRVSGSNSVWNQGGDIIQLDLSGNKFLITDGALVTNAARIWVGYGTPSGNASLVISNGGQLYTAAGASYLGGLAGSTNSSIMIAGTNAITGASALWDNGGSAGALTVGAKAAGDNYNTLTVGAGGVFTNAGNLTIGGVGGACFNSLIITNGGQVFTLQAGYIGSSGSTNSGWVGGTNPANGKPSLWNLGAAALILGNSSGAVGNVLRVDNGGVVTNVGGSGVVVGYNLGANGNSVVITNGGKVFTGTGVNIGQTGAAGNAIVINNGTLTVNAGTCFVGAASTGNTATVTANGVWDMGGQYLLVGGSTGASPGSNNSVLVTAGGAITNWGSNGIEVGPAPGGLGNSLIATNGGRIHMATGGIAVGAWNGNTPSAGGNGSMLMISSGALTSGGYDSYIGFGSASNLATFSGATVWNEGGKILYVGHRAATGNVLRVDGCSVTNVATLMVGSTNLALNNSVIITNGGVLAATTVQAGLFAAAGSLVQVSSGGLLEGNTITVGTNAGNQIVNVNGIYQFATATPAITNSGFGNITLASGTIAFRGIPNANVKGNWGGTSGTNGISLTNIQFTGVNTFRLNNATNNVAAPDQSYVFATGLGATNYTRLELINSARYMKGSITLGTGASMLVSNGVCTVSNLTLQSGSTLQVALTPGAPAPLTVEGALQLGSSTLAVTLNGAPAAGTTYPIVTDTLSQSSLGAFQSSSIIAPYQGTNYTLYVRAIPGAGGGVSLRYNGQSPGTSVFIF